MTLNISTSHPIRSVGISASFNSFPENDDANRALMNQMPASSSTAYQTIPPIVGTGLEGKVAHDSRMLINAEGDGVVDYNRCL